MHYAIATVAGLALTLASVGSLEARADNNSNPQYAVRDTTSQQDKGSKASIGYAVLGIAVIGGIDAINKWMSRDLA